MPQVPPRVLSKTEDVLTVARKVHEVTAKLRQHEEVVTPETGGNCLTSRTADGAGAG